MSFEFIRHLVDLPLQPGVSGELIHHVDGGELLLHALDLGSHLGLLLCILLQHPGHLGEETVGSGPCHTPPPPSYVLAASIFIRRQGISSHLQTIWGARVYHPRSGRAHV